MVASLLLSFCSQQHNKIKTKCDGNKLIVVTHFPFKQKNKMGDASKLVIVALFATTTTTTKEKKM